MRFLCFFFCLLLALQTAKAQDNSNASLNHTSAEQAILVDYSTDMVLFSKNADEKMVPSSMTKTMTIYMVFQALQDGRLRLDTMLPVSEKAWRKGGSKMFVEHGKRVAVEDLIRGVVVQSGNDAAIVLAEGLAGSEDAFATAMTDKAKSIGMNNTNFVNASGWPDDNHYTTARDLATLAMRLIKDFPNEYHYFAEQEYSYNNINQRNRNPLIYRDIGVDGIKTGHTESGGYGLMASGKRNERRVLLVVNGLNDEKARAQESARLMEWGLKGFENINLFAVGDIVTKADVIMGKKTSVDVSIQNDIFVTIPSSFKNDLKVDTRYEGPLVAPIKKGTEIGELFISIPKGETMKFALYANEDIEELGFISMTIEKLKHFIKIGS